MNCYRRWSVVSSVFGLSIVFSAFGETSELWNGRPVHIVASTVLAETSSPRPQSPRQQVLSAGPKRAMAVEQRAPEKRGGTWPILYVDRDEKEKKSEKGIIRGVYPNGRRITIARWEPWKIPVWSPKGKWMARLAMKQRRRSLKVELMNLEGDRKDVFRTDKAAIAFGPAWSPDGRRLAVLLLRSAVPPSAFSLIVLDVEKHRVMARHKLSVDITDPTGLPKKFRWSPDGQKILLSGGDSTVVINTVSGKIEIIGKTPVLLEWGLDGEEVYYFEAPPGSWTTLGTFYVKRLGSATPTKLLGSDELRDLGIKCDSDPCVFTLSSDGRRLALYTSAQKPGTDGFTDDSFVSVVRIYDLVRGQTVALDEPSQTLEAKSDLLSLQWSPTGDALGAVAFGAIFFLDLRNGKWRRLAGISGGEIIGMGYGLGYPMMNWTQH